MNKTWSIILIVVASLVVLGGTYWYFGMQKPKPQDAVPTVATVEPVRKSPAPPTSAEAEQPRPQPVVEPKVKPAQPEAEKAEIGKPIPEPKAPSITDLAASFGSKGAKTDTSTSVLANEALPSKVKESTSPTLQDTKTEPVLGTEKPLAGQEDLSQAKDTAPESTAPESTTPEDIASEGTNNVQEEETPLIGDDSTEEQQEQQTPPVPIIAPQKGETLSNDTTAESTIKPTQEINLSFSIFDRNFPIQFDPIEKSFTVSLEYMFQKEFSGWGGTFEAGKNNDTGVVQVSLLAKREWKLGKGRVTYPLSISLGPTLFRNSATKATTLGMKAKLGAGVTYSLSDSYRFFYALGVGATYDFWDNTSFRFVLEPLRIGVGFSF